jgi:hypothetical protein
VFFLVRVNSLKGFTLTVCLIDTNQPTKYNKRQVPPRWQRKKLQIATRVDDKLKYICHKTVAIGGFRNSVNIYLSFYTGRQVIVEEHAHRLMPVGRLEVHVKL